MRRVLDPTKPLRRYAIWASGGVLLGEVEAPRDSRALLDYAEREGIEGELRGTNTFVISDTEKLYASEPR